jgi:DNA-binding NtrC family response regulator
VSKPATLKLLAIDDDPQTLSLIAEALGNEGLEVLTAEDPEAGFEIFLRFRPRIVLVDLFLASVNGMDVLARILASDPGANVILISGHYSAEAALEAIEQGACDYLTKPLDFAKLRHRVGGFIAEAEVRRKTLLLDQELVQACQFEGIVSRSPLMLEVFAKIRRVAPHFKTALVTGATGTGKELVARALHQLSPSSPNRFVACNCSALVESLAESELFGYVKGAFTGAFQDRAGLFENADGGTIFLDEIGDLSLAVQAKLLRVLQDHHVRRVGSSVSRSVNMRVIAATHRDLKKMVREGQFREDLYYRLAVAEIRLPLLAHRREDLPLLQRYFLERFAAEYDKPISGLTRRAQARMANYPWPGNVRELENVIGNSCMMVDGQFIDINDLPDQLREGISDESTTDEVLLSLDEIQKRHILRVLERVGGNRAQAAKILGLGRATIYEFLSKMKQEDNDVSA